MMRRWPRLAFLLLRTVAGVMFAMHGSQRLFGWPAGQRAAEPLRIAASALELITGALIACGIAVPIAALAAGLAMAIGAITRRQELLVLYSLLWLWMAAESTTFVKRPDA
jgi:putative oxidoreductase